MKAVIKAALAGACYIPVATFATSTISTFWDDFSFNPSIPETFWYIAYQSVQLSWINAVIGILTVELSVLYYLLVRK